MPGNTTSACQGPYMQCNTADQACTCASGVDACYGYCIPTPCGACNTCVKSFRAFTSQVKDTRDATVVAQAWDAACKSSPGRTSTSCDFIRAQILASPDGNLGKRAGMVCQLLQECASVPSDCLLEATSADPAPLDLCTVGGTSIDAQVPSVQSAAKFSLPDGRCFESINCAKTTGWLCNKQTTTDVKTCSAGVEGFMTLGTCERTPCQACKVSIVCTVHTNMRIQ